MGSKKTSIIALYLSINAIINITMTITNLIVSTIVVIHSMALKFVGFAALRAWASLSSLNFGLFGNP